MNSATEAETDRPSAMVDLVARIGQTGWTIAWKPLAYLLASAAMLGLAVPPHGLAVAAWVALVPLLLAIRNESPASAALVGLAFGFASLAIMHTWFLELPGANIFNTSALFGYLSLYPATWCAAVALLMRRKLPWVFPGAVLWVVLDGVRSHAGFLALPRDVLSHSQVGDLPLLQLAAFGGAPAIAFVVCLTNLAAARAVHMRSLRPLVVPLVLFAAVHTLGYARLQEAEPHAEMNIALIQPANDKAPFAERLRKLSQLTAQAAALKPDLIVWPESAVGGFALQPSVAASVANIANVANTPILFGSSDFGKYAQQASDRAEQIQFKNEAYLVFPDGTVHGPVIKNRLVPFAEYMPLDDYVDWPRWLVARQLHGVAGTDPEILEFHDIRVGVSICWENLFTEHTGRLVDHGASIIVQLSNDSDFGVSAEPAQHNAASVLRAVEYARPVLLVSADGPSLAIDARGRVTGQLGPTGTAGWMVASLHGESQTTPYTTWSLAWLWLAAVLASICLIRDSHSQDKHRRIKKWHV